MELERHKVIIEIETGDIDDTIALIYALMCPYFDIKAVLVCSGTKQQLGLIEKIYDYISLPNEKKPILGSLNFDNKPNSKLSPIYKRSYGIFKDYEGEMRLGKDIIIDFCKKYPNEIIYITLGPPKILSQALLENDYIQVKQWVAQGGFAGVGVVDENKILWKFKGKSECPTWNLGSAIIETKFLLNHSRIGSRHFISKNVCHGIVYNTDFHNEMRMCSKQNTFTHHFYNIMDNAYFKHKQNVNSSKKKSIKKKIHDILPLMTIFDKNVCEFREVQLYYNHKTSSWGSYLCNGINTFISVDYDSNLYFKLLIDYTI